MKKIIVVLLISIFSCPISLFAQTSITPIIETTEIKRIDLIKIHVKSRKAEFVQNSSQGTVTSFEYPAATPTKKNSKTVPFGIKGWAYRITLNPGYTPTKDHLKKERAKGIKNPKKFYEPGAEDNPLGIMKIYFYFPGIDPELSFGMHTTNNPKSIGKRASEGCARISEQTATEMFSIILKQNGKDAEILMSQARKDPHTPIVVELSGKNMPSVIYLND